MTAKSSDLTEAAIDTALVRLSQGFCSLKGIGEAEASATDEILFDEWDWEVGVGLYGDFRRAEACEDTAAFDKLARWYDRQIVRGLPRRQINSTAPMLTLALLAGRTKRPDWETVVKDWAEWIHTQMPRTEEGGYQHLVKERDNIGQLWDDTLFMAALFMAAAGEMAGRQDWIDDAHAQFATHIRYLGDPATGLFFHGWTFVGRHNFARALWARGNAWVTLSIPELYRISPPRGGLDLHLRHVWNTQVCALLKMQNEDGLFHTLLDDPESPLEASGTAGIAYGILAGRKIGLLDPAAEADLYDCIDGAAVAIWQRIGPDGLLSDVSDGTPMGDTLAFYRDIPMVAAPYGQALASLFFVALGEDLRFLKTRIAAQ